MERLLYGIRLTIRNGCGTEFGKWYGTIAVWNGFGKRYGVLLRARYGTVAVLNSVNSTARLRYGVISFNGTAFGERLGAWLTVRNSVSDTERLRCGMTSANGAEFGERYGTVNGTE